MAASSERRLLLVLAAAAALLNCSLTRPSTVECSSNADCRAAFGLGAVCAGDGFCETAKPRARCTEAEPSDLLTRPERYTNAQIFGALMDRSVSTQAARENAIRLATQQASDEGGLSGRGIGVVFCDVAADTTYDALTRTEAAVDSARWLSRTLGVPAIIGPSSSTDVLAVFEALKNDGTLVISPSATSPALTGVDTATPSDDAPGLLWRTAAPDTIQAAAIARWFAKQAPAVKSVFVINEVGAYGDALVGEFLPQFQADGGSATVRTFTSPTERDAAVIEAGTDAAPWVLFVSSQTPDAAAFLNAAAALSGFDTKMVFLTDSAANSGLLDATKASTSIYPRVRGSRPGLPSGNVYEQFRATYNAAYSAEANDFSFVAHAYDATWLVFLGAAWSSGQEQSVTGLGIAKGLRRVDSAGSAVAILPTSWKQLSQAFSEGTRTNLTGASGTLDYDAATEETSGPIDIWQIASSGSAIEVLETDPGT